MNQTIIFAMFAALLLIPAGAYAQERGPTRDELLEASVSGPVYLDSYWTTLDSTSENLTNRGEVQVGPGDGASTLAVVLVNWGPSEISGITGQLSLPAGFKATGKAAGAPAAASFNQIAAVGNPFVLFFDVDILDSAKVGEYSAQLKVGYSKVFETGAPRTADITVPFRITGEAILTVSGESSTDATGDQISAGKIQDYTIKVENKGTTPITNVVVTAKSPAESLKILGDSKWTIQRIEENSQASLATKVFAANALIGNPASLDVTIEYSSEGRSSTEEFTLGTYVAGDISIRAYEVEVNYIGGAPNIVGNLLNEGNTVALFTTIELVGDSKLVSSRPPAQYLGDLEENSPLPFSIPIDVASAGAGTYPVSLKVTYKDNLRQLHTLDVNSQVNFVPEQAADESADAAAGMNMLVPIAIAVAIAAVIVAVVVVRRRKKSAFKRKMVTASGNGDDIEKLLDGQRVEKRHDERK